MSISATQPLISFCVASAYLRCNFRASAEGGFEPCGQRGPAVIGGKQPKAEPLV